MQAHGPCVFNVYHVNTHSHLYKTSNLHSGRPGCGVSLCEPHTSKLLWVWYIYGQYCS